MTEQANEQRDFYQVLKMSRTASQSEISKAFKLLSRENHPDKNNGNETDEYRAIAAAYDTLKDVEKRKVYDNYLNQGHNKAVEEVSIAAENISEQRQAEAEAEAQAEEASTRARSARSEDLGDVDAETEATASQRAATEEPAQPKAAAREEAETEATYSRSAGRYEADLETEINDLARFLEAYFAEYEARQLEQRRRVQEFWNNASIPLFCIFENVLFKFHPQQFPQSPRFPEFEADPTPAYERRLPERTEYQAAVPLQEIEKLLADNQIPTEKKVKDGKTVLVILGPKEQQDAVFECLQALDMIKKAPEAPRARM
ncbi:MAG: DnaJ domain-containing protein [Gammaproteobacteria bacterium]